MIAVCFLAVCLALTVAVSTGAATAGQERATPGGKWSIGYHGYMGPGFNLRPVLVVSVTSEVDKGATATFVKNNAADSVAAVKLKWFLVTEDNRRTVLRQGETPLIELPHALPPGGKTQVQYPVVMFEHIWQPLIKHGRLDGDYRIEVAVSEVRYTSAPKWKWGDPFTAKAVKLMSALDAGGGGCANQTCKKHGDHYECDTGEGELCTNFGTTCDNAICNLLD
jgi:hypothetical protein